MGIGALFLAFLELAHAQDSSFVALTPKAARAISNLELRKTKNFVQQYKRVDEFDCKSELGGLKKFYNKQRALFVENKNTGSVNFPKLSPAEREKLGPLFPPTFTGFIAQVNRPEITGDKLGLLLSTISRETDFDMFLDEKSDSPVVNGKGGRPGAGLLQMTAWTPEYIEKYGPHDYSLYETDRIKETAREFGPATSRATVDFTSKWLPTTVDIDSTKEKISTADQFIRSPYNPVASMWFGRNAMERSEKELNAMGIRELRGPNRSAIIGAFYNGGKHRVRCAMERVNTWNDFFSSLDIQFEEQAYKFEVSEWRSLRSMLYLDKDMMKKAGVPDDLINRLGNVCKGKPEKECSCLDQEPPTNPRSVLRGFDFKGAVMMSYGDHMEKLHDCFEDYVEKNKVYFSPDLPEECRPDL